MGPETALEGLWDKALTQVRIKIGEDIELAAEAWVCLRVWQQRYWKSPTQDPLFWADLLLRMKKTTSPTATSATIIQVHHGTRVAGVPHIFVPATLAVAVNSG